jgi:hypothetical protein
MLGVLNGVTETAESRWMATFWKAATCASSIAGATPGGEVASLIASHADKLTEEAAPSRYGDGAGRRCRSTGSRAGRRRWATHRWPRPCTPTPPCRISITNRGIVRGPLRHQWQLSNSDGPVKTAEPAGRCRWDEDASP